MIGAIIGDIVGSRFEFDNYRATDFELFTEESTFTDDTVCTVAVAHWILVSSERGVTSAERFATMLKEWCDKYPNESYGARFSQWIASPAKQPDPYNSFGNGAAMRISPVGDYFSSLDDTLHASDMVTGVTHNHPEGIKGARAVAEAMFIVRKGARKEEMKSTIEKTYGYDLSTSCETIRDHNHFDETCQITVPQAIVAFLESRDFEDAIRLAVSIGGDSDTIAAITGGLAEVYYKDINPVFLEEVKDRIPKEMLDILRDFYRKLSGKEEVIFGGVVL